MAENTKFDEFIAEEVKAIKGVYVPVKAGILRRALIRETRCFKLHPNPDDEFCMPKVGPNYGIISDYMRIFREERGHSRHYCEERLVVEKIRPDGYLILNGHHRWAAAMNCGVKKVPVKIVNLTEVDNITRELVLIKVRATAEARADLINIVNIFRAKIVDVSKENVVIELTGEESKINAICEVLSEYEIVEIARTGAIALSRGPVPVKQMQEN